MGHPCPQVREPWGPPNPTALLNSILKGEGRLAGMTPARADGEPPEVKSPPPSHFGDNKYCVTLAGRVAHWAWPPVPHSVRRMMWMPESVKTGPLISPVRSAKEASSKGFCIWPREAVRGGVRGSGPCASQGQADGAPSRTEPRAHSAPSAMRLMAPSQCPSQGGRGIKALGSRRTV